MHRGVEKKEYSERKYNESEERRHRQRMKSEVQEIKKGIVENRYR